MKTENDQPDSAPPGQEPAARQAPFEGVASAAVNKIKNQRFLLVIVIAVILAGLVVALGGASSPGVWITVGVIALLPIVVVLLDYLEKRPSRQIVVPFPDRVFGDGRVEDVKQSLNRLHEEYGDQPVPLPTVFSILKQLFVRRNTFTEYVPDCPDENWADRFIAAAETQHLLDQYWPYIQRYAKLGDGELVRSIEQLDLHRYVGNLTLLFEPVPRAADEKEALRKGRSAEVKQRLRSAEIHPRARIKQEDSAACDEQQDRMKKIWDVWPSG